MVETWEGSSKIETRGGIVKANSLEAGLCETKPLEKRKNNEIEIKLQD